MTKITEEYQAYIDADREKLERYLKDLDVSPYPLGDYCGYKKSGGCKYFGPICGKKIPLKNSSLNYINNAAGFVREDGTRIKGLELINEGYLKMLDIPETWITKKKT